MIGILGFPHAVPMAFFKDKHFINQQISDVELFVVIHKTLRATSPWVGILVAIPHFQIDVNDKVQRLLTHRMDRIEFSGMNILGKTFADPKHFLQKSHSKRHTRYTDERLRIRDILIAFC